MLREELTADEVRKYTNPQFLEHLAKKGSREIGGFQHRDPLFQTASSHKPDYSVNKRQEKGIKIKVGGPSTT